MSSTFILNNIAKMTKDLATVKQAYLISMSNWDKHIVLLEKEPDWDDIIDNKRAVHIDGKRLNGSYIVSVEDVDLNNELPDSAFAYAKLLRWAMKVVACERVRSYEATNGKMPIEKLKNRLGAFINKWKTQEFEKRYTLFISNGWNPDDIW